MQYKKTYKCITSNSLSHNDVIQFNNFTTTAHINSQTRIQTVSDSGAESTDHLVWQRVQIPETVGQCFLQSETISSWLVNAQIAYAVNIKVKDNNYNYANNYL
jgi:hypothetical protein